MFLMNIDTNNLKKISACQIQEYLKKYTKIKYNLFQFYKPGSKFKSQTI